jgi:hypothetical protein
MYTELKDFGYLMMWGVVVGLLLTWAIGTYIENVKTIHYWRGRKDGWDMHRRMSDNKQAVKDARQFDPDGYYADNN